MAMGKRKCDFCDEDATYTINSEADIALCEKHYYPIIVAASHEVVQFLCEVMERAKTYKEFKKQLTGHNPIWKLKIVKKKRGGMRR
ncbi:hypothetical protein ES703_09839 [subsurface metagenome]